MLGQSLLHYQITAKLGQGGMGEVYRATDTKLDREVAIKLLPSALAQDKERLARFKREAKLLAQLSHSHIASVHDFDEHEGTCFLVMEHVDGEDLSERLKRGSLSIDQSIEIGQEIAEALEAAHAKGIIHRDLKPANIKVNADGQVKVLDFGLAKATASSTVLNELGTADATDVDSDSPTITADFTRPGTILGTAAYMSPEQARGKALDQRTDVWAFGCVLFECLTGRRAFAGDDATDTLAAIIKGEPDWSALPPETPLSLRHLLRKCLSKDCRHRLHEIADARIDLDIAQGEVSEPSARETDGHVKGWRIHPAFALVGVVLLLIVGIMLGRRSAPDSKPQDNSIRKLNVELTKEGHLALDSGNAIQLSPDGKTLGYIVMTGDERRLMLRKLDQLKGVELVEARGADQFCFSPNGQSIAFTGDSMAFLMTVPVSGGSTTKICEVNRPRGLDWADGWIYITLGRGDAISRVVETGGEPDRITQLTEGEDSHRWPHVLPGGKAILYTSQVRPFKNAESKIMAQLLGGREPVLVRNGGHDARYLEETQSLVFSNGESLLAGRFNPDTLTLGNEAPLPVIQSVATSTHAAVHVTTSSDGTLFYVDGGVHGNAAPRQFQWVDREGNQEIIPIPAGYYQDSFRISPTGNHLMYGRDDDDEIHLWLYDLKEGGEPKQFTFGTGRNRWPRWSPSGEMILYHSSAHEGLVTKRRNGLGGEKPLREGLNDERFRLPSEWSLDGRSIYFWGFEGNRWFIGVLELTGDDQAGWELVGESELTLERSDASSIALSLGGRWIAYEAGEDASSRIFVESGGPQHGIWLVSVGNRRLRKPRWLSKTQELMFSVRESRIYSLYSTKFREVEGAFVSEKPVPWPKGNLSDDDAYDIHPDGSRVLVLRETAQTAQPISEVICFDDFEAYLEEQWAKEGTNP